MSTNIFVRNQLYIMAGPVLAVLGAIVMVAIYNMTDLDNLTMGLGCATCLLFAVFPLAAKYPRLTEPFAVTVVFITFLALASSGYQRTGIVDGGIIMMCVLPYLAGFFIGRKTATATLFAVFFYIAYCLYKYKVNPSPLESVEGLGDTIARALMIVLTSICGYWVAIVFSGKSNDYSQKLLALNESLEAATSKALDADRAKSEFLANMSHEIRTPMNGVIGMAELLNKTELTQKQRLFSDTILKSGNSLLTIINDILDFSKIEAGQLTLDPAPFDLRELIDDVAAIVAPRIGTKNVELIIRVAPGAPAAVVGDAGRIRQVLINLMGNAVKFTDKGHVFVDVSTAPEIAEPGATTTICVRIEDTGIGMQPDECERVFGKFSQADSSSTRKHEGTGLGLSIALSLVSMMDGDIKVSSEFGKGSVFSVTMKLPISALMAPAKNLPILNKKSRVLVIDDNAVNRTILIEQLSGWNFDCAAVSSGTEAFELLAKAHAMGIAIDLIILDYQMPVMDGKAVLAKLRAHESTKTISVLLLTSIDAAQNDKDLSAMGLQASLTKPARSSILYDTIVQVLHAVPAHSPIFKPDTVAISEAKQLPVEVATKSGLGSGHIDVLIAEDNEINQIVMRQTMEMLPYSYEIVSNGKLAVDSWRKHQPRMILMDISMPEMNGKEATAAIRSLEQTQGGHTPIVALTAHALKGDMEECINAGMDDYMSKPINHDKLVTMLERHLSPSGTSRQNAA